MFRQCRRRLRGAKEYAEEGRHDGEDVQNQAENLNGAAVKPSGYDSQGGNILRVGFYSLFMAHGQVEGHGVRENRNEQDAEGNLHSPHRFIPRYVDRLVMRTVGNNHRADAGQEQNRRQRNRQHGDGILNQKSQVGEYADVGDIPMLNHDASEANDDEELGQNHERRHAEQQLFAPRRQATMTQMIARP